LVETLHHIVTDGWSTSIIIKEVAELYAAYVENRKANLAPLSIQHADYAIWQRNYLQGEVLNKKINYWKNKLADVVPLQLPTDFVRPALRSNRGSSLEFNIDNELYNQLQLLYQQQGATLFMTLLATFNVLLHRYSGKQDICVGSPIANRTQQEVEGLIGFFTNTVTLRNEVKPESSFIDLLQQVSATTMEAYEHQEVPFEKVVEVVVKERDLSRNPLFQVALVMQSIPEIQEFRLGEVQLSAEEFTRGRSRFDIAFFINQSENVLRGSVEYSTDLYHEATISRMLGHFKELLSSIVKDPHQKIGELAMLTREEEQQLLVDFNNTAVDYPKDKTIVCNA
jgi:non-ribosomal peptide synthetase component F